MTDSTSIRQRSDSAARSDNGILEQQIQHLLVAVEHELRQAPDGVSELALIKALQQPPWELIGDVCFNDPEKLYPVHFLLFHTLYRLRDQLSQTSETLQIAPLRIRLVPQTVIGGSGLPDEKDKLREFYLDLSQYRLPEDAIQRMMDDFWAGRPGNRPEASETLAAAEKLGFNKVPDSFPEVKQRFRRAVMQAHPDRGGDTRSIQALNQAFAVLKAHFQLAT
ncbi:DNA-J related domain-containing protein [Marinobacter sp. F4206]|uniref:DNA-J related domain-containing protein n=1 Tax=Marinobacter sp. F4206 TaxID=2861777 RepID=UPI001C5E396E|nr:DNA-J related domain-containing protein [Marinobacter sp. F4206]MBW4933543.1 molecular chaperone DnaJ [Marinobacter sp. F4206]